ncbi:MutS-related protein [Sphingobacterium paludis]|nr:DNA mismatch repair protein [Sphingobacterium paludis]
MSFLTDKQTLKDLHILGKYRRDSIFSVFNCTQTFGGEHLLESMFQQPLTRLADINKRSDLVAFFRRQQQQLIIDLEDLDLAQNFISGDAGGSMLQSSLYISRNWLWQKLGLPENRTHFQRAIRAVIRLLAQLRAYIQSLGIEQHQPLLGDTPLANLWILESKELHALEEELAKHAENLPFALAVRGDYLLRYRWSNALRDAFSMIYFIDTFQSIAQVANARGFIRAEARPAEQQTLLFSNLYHPTVPNAVGNDIAYSKDSNLIFLTGANMAGKSTYMKSLGIAIYLAHMGFPVPAAQMQFSIKEGLFTSINVEDDISLGHSHYYAEVLRVKTVAEAVAQGKQLLVIFDELFKGTNVKDAFEATFAVSAAFQKHTSCQYLISTHIVEVGEQLKTVAPQVQFLKMPTIMRGQIPTYTYRAEPGISADKHGMVLIHKENVLELLEKSRSKF